MEERFPIAASSNASVVAGTALGQPIHGPRAGHGVSSCAVRGRAAISVPTHLVARFGEQASAAVAAMMKRCDPMPDKILGNFSTALRTPDIKFTDVRVELVGVKAGEELDIHKPGRTVFIFTRSGDWELSFAEQPGQTMLVSSGTGIGIERGQLHKWRAKTSGEMLLSSAPRTVALIQQLQGGYIMVPPSATPYSSVLKLAVDIMAVEIQSGHAETDGNVIRRCAEITLIQMIRYASNSLVFAGAPKQIVHDEFLLRAWVAYFAAPQDKWTVKALAEAAGLGRTAFSQRFTAAFGTPPLQTLTRLRLQQGQEMLRNSQAPLIEIAFTVGYHSEAAFVRAFHREFGVPPGKYRSRYQKT